MSDIDLTTITRKEKDDCYGIFSKSNWCFRKFEPVFFQGFFNGVEYQEKKMELKVEQLEGRIAVLTAMVDNKNSVIDSLRR